MSTMALRCSEQINDDCAARNGILIASGTKNEKQLLAEHFIGRKGTVVCPDCHVQWRKENR